MANEEIKIPDNITTFDEIDKFAKLEHGKVGFCNFKTNFNKINGDPELWNKWKKIEKLIFKKKRQLRQSQSRFKLEEDTLQQKKEKLIQEFRSSYENLKDACSKKLSSETKRLMRDFLLMFRQPMLKMKYKIKNSQDLSYEELLDFSDDIIRFLESKDHEIDGLLQIPDNNTDTKRYLNIINPIIERVVPVILQEEYTELKIDNEPVKKTVKEPVKESEQEKRARQAFIKKERERVKLGHQVNAKDQSKRARKMNENYEAQRKSKVNEIAQKYIRNANGKSNEEKNKAKQKANSLKLAYKEELNVKEHQKKFNREKEKKHRSALLYKSKYFLYIFDKSNADIKILIQYSDLDTDIGFLYDIRIPNTIEDIKEVFNSKALDFDTSNKSFFLDEDGIKNFKEYAAKKNPRIVQIENWADLVTAPYNTRKSTEGKFIYKHKLFYILSRFIDIIDKKTSGNRGRKTRTGRPPAGPSARPPAATAPPAGPPAARHVKARKGEKNRKSYLVRKNIFDPQINKNIKIEAIEEEDPELIYIEVGKDESKLQEIKYKIDEINSQDLECKCMEYNTIEVNGELLIVISIYLKDMMYSKK